MKIWQLKKSILSVCHFDFVQNIQIKIIPTTLVFRDPKASRRNCRLLQTASLWEMLLFSDDQRRGGAEMFMARATFANEQKHQIFIFQSLLGPTENFIIFSTNNTHTRIRMWKRKSYLFVFKFFVWIIIKGVNFGMETVLEH